MINAFDPCTAMCLSIIGAGLEAFDVSHLQAEWRDMMLGRLTYLLWAITGAQALSCTELLRARGTKNRVRGLLSPWLLRLRCTIDGFKILQLQQGVIGMGRTIENDDLELLFSMLTKRAGGYMPSLARALTALKTVIIQSTNACTEDCDVGFLTCVFSR
jgi:hypothetical protein